MYDAVDPSAIPADAILVAGYLDGKESAWPPDAWNWFPNATMVRIVISPYNFDGDVLDIEQFNWPSSYAVDWINGIRARGKIPNIYGNNGVPGFKISEVLAYCDAAGIEYPQIWWAAGSGPAVIPPYPPGCVANQYLEGVTVGVNYDTSVVADYWPGVDPAPMPAPQPDCAEYLKNDQDAIARMRSAIADLEVAIQNITYPPTGAVMPQEEVPVENETVILPSGVVDGPITWPQLLGGWLSDAPFFLIAALSVLATWLQSDAPATTRGIVTIAILAILAGLTAVQRATGSDGLSLRLRAKGQIKGGK